MAIFSNFIKSIFVISVISFIADVHATVPPQLSQITLSSDSAGLTLHYSNIFEISSDSVMDSAPLHDFATELDSLMHVDTVTAVSITGLSSIDGPESINNRLAHERAMAMKTWLEKNSGLSSEIITTNAKGEDWDLFQQLITEDPQIPFPEKIMEVLNSKQSLASKEALLRHIDEGEAWKYLANNILPQMRRADVSVNLKYGGVPYTSSDTISLGTLEMSGSEEISFESLEIVDEQKGEEWRRHFYIKTDLPYWLMLWSNLAFEVDLAKHWSFSLPIYYSALNYFKHTIKFRIFGFQPGFRYWLKPENRGVYFEARYGMGWYDFAFNGAYRYQSKGRKCPAVGGGISAGYRLPISGNGRWTMEFGAGIGAYRLHYDRFINDYNGKLVDSKKKSYFGIDNINVSISYSFPIEKKKERAK